MYRYTFYSMFHSLPLSICLLLWTYLRSSQSLVAPLSHFANETDTSIAEMPLHSTARSAKTDSSTIAARTVRQCSCTPESVRFVVVLLRDDWWFAHCTHPTLNGLLGANAVNRTITAVKYIHSGPGLTGDHLPSKPIGSSLVRWVWSVSLDIISEPTTSRQVPQKLLIFFPNTNLLFTAGSIEAAAFLLDYYKLCLW